VPESATRSVLSIQSGVRKFWRSASVLDRIEHAGEDRRCGARATGGCSIFGQSGRWEGDQFALYERDGKRVAFREVCSEFTETSFTQTIHEDEEGAKLKRVTTIHARRIRANKQR
jgi:hypothetical protein